MKMKDLERATGVGREAIRFYIREGLLPEPIRTARNVAWYDPSFVERVLLIKKLQQERYLPLTVIRSIVAEDPPPSEAEVRTLRDLDGKLTPVADAERARAAERLGELAARVGVAPAELRALAAMEAVEIQTREGEEWLEGKAVTIAELWGRLRRAGYSEALGFGPEDLTLYVEVARWLAREELRLFTRHVAGKVDGETSRRMAHEGLECVNRILALVHETAVLRSIAAGGVAESRENGPGGRRATGT
jgi:DNA-binding transcriptional MerR regulator